MICNMEELYSRFDEETTDAEQLLRVTCNEYTVDINIGWIRGTIGDDNVIIYENYDGMNSDNIDENYLTIERQFSYPNFDPEFMSDLLFHLNLNESMELETDDSKTLSVTLTDIRYSVQ